MWHENCGAIYQVCVETRLTHIKGQSPWMVGPGSFFMWTRSWSALPSSNFIMKEVKSYLYLTFSHILLPVTKASYSTQDKLDFAAVTHRLTNLGRLSTEGFFLVPYKASESWTDLLALGLWQCNPPGQCAEEESPAGLHGPC